MALLLPNGDIRRRLIMRLRPDLVKPMTQVKLDAIESALILCGGNKKLAAESLEVSYRTVLYACRRFRRESKEFLKSQVRG